MRKYKDFRLKYREQDPRDVFCDFSFVTQSDASWEYPYEKLAQIAQPENWGGYPRGVQIALPTADVSYPHELSQLYLPPFARPQPHRVYR